jgi:hypothetical protein
MQLHEPVHMIRHHDIGERCGSRGDHLAMQSPNDDATEMKVAEQALPITRHGRDDAFCFVLEEGGGARYAVAKSQAEA